MVSRTMRLLLTEKNGNTTEQPAEQLDFETESDGETEEEERMYDETLQYLMHGRYPEGASKQDKGVIRKRSKHSQSQRWSAVQSLH